DPRETLLPASGRRPLHLESCAVESCDVEVAWRGPGMHRFAPGLPHRAELHEIPVRRRLTELLLELAACHVDRGFARLDLAFRYRPGALVAFFPERSAGVHQQNFGPALAIAKQQKTRALHCSIPCHPGRTARRARSLGGKHGGGLSWQTRPRTHGTGSRKTSRVWPASSSDTTDRRATKRTQPI